MAAAAAHNLPLQLSAFVGREREIAQAKQSLARHRLVTLTGAGGSGKTRLALQTAEELLPVFADGVWFIDFTPLADETLVAQAAATVLGVREQPARPLVGTLIDHLQEGRTLLILDNCEHLVGACAQLATDLLQGCPNLRILATSREPLGVAGELVSSVPPLSLPAAQPWHDPAGAQAALSVYGQAEAVQLFVTRALTASPAFTLSVENGPWVAEICRRLDGMPLAIELAAARVRGLSVREIAQRLDDRFRLLTGGSRTAPPRQQTLAAALDWSYRLLADDERKVLLRLSVFSGGCTLAAAESVCADDADGANNTLGAGAVLDVLLHLVDKSLVVAEQKEDGTRYRLLETIRQYAGEKLIQFGEAQRIRERHCAFFVAWAEGAQAQIDGPDQVVWLRRYEAEHDNVRSALEWCRADASRADASRADASRAAGLRLAAACAQFWELHAYGSEGAAHLVQALADAGQNAPPTVRAWALSRLASLLFMRSEFPAMRGYAEEALALWRALGADGRAGLAFTLFRLGDLALEEGSYALAEAQLQEALAIYRERNDTYGISGALMVLGWAAMRTGDYSAAAAHLEECRALAQQMGDLRNTAFALSGLGEIALRQRQYERAEALLNESLRLNREGGYHWSVATVLGSLGWAALAQRNYARMRAALRESLSLRMAIGDPAGIAWCLEKLAEAALIQGQDASTQGTAPVQLKQCQIAARIFGAAAHLRAPINSAIDAVDQPAYDRSLAALRAALGEGDFTAAWAQGAALPLPAAVEYALAQAAPESLPGPALHPAVQTAPDAAQPREPSNASAEKWGGLSARECEVAVLIAQGKSNREIAAAMTVGVKTVETYITRIFNKLGFDSRVQVATWAVEGGLAFPSEP